MVIYREKTKRGAFVAEAGTTGNQSSKFEAIYWAGRSDKERWQATWDLFTNYHLNHGCKPEDLRLDRTVIEIGRRPSKTTHRRRS